MSKRDGQRVYEVDGWANEDGHAWEVICEILESRTRGGSDRRETLRMTASALLFELRDRGFRVRADGAVHVMTPATDHIPTRAVLPPGWTDADVIGYGKLVEIIGALAPRVSKQKNKAFAVSLVMELHERGLRVVFLPEAKAVA